jgi:predicted GNAT superfamily acetyltransferase
VTSLGKLDLFDALSISRYENSYTKLAGEVLEMNPEIAASFYRGAFGEEPAGTAVKTRTQVTVRHQEDRGRDIPDLVVAFHNGRIDEPTDV